MGSLKKVYGYYPTDEVFLPLKVDSAGAVVLSSFGWITVSDTWTYSSWDATVLTGIITVPTGAASRYSAGMRIKITQPTDGVKYGIITAVADTALTVFFGTDYDLDNEAISSPYYSPVKAPLGFPLDPDKWTVEVTDTVDRQETNPTGGTWYNTGSILINIPIGVWNVEYNVCCGTYDAGTANRQYYITLSTSSNSESDPDFTGSIFIVYLAWNVTQIYKRKMLNLSSKTPYYLIHEVLQAGIDRLYFFNSSGSKCIIRAISAYL